MKGLSVVFTGLLFLLTSQLPSWLAEMGSLPAQHHEKDSARGPEQQIRPQVLLVKLQRAPQASILN